MAIKTFTTGEVLTASDTNTFLANAGLVYVKSQTVGTGVSSVLITNAFSSMYDNYKIVYNGGVGNTFQDLAMTLGSTNTGYYWSDSGFSFVNGSYTGTGSNAVSNAFWRVGKNTVDGSLINLEIFNPFLSLRTFFNSCASFANTGAGFVVNGGFLNNNTSYTDFTISPIGSTITGGTITVYGYRKA